LIFVFFILIIIKGAHIPLISICRVPEEKGLTIEENNIIIGGKREEIEKELGIKLKPFKKEEKEEKLICQSTSKISAENKKTQKIEDVIPTYFIPKLKPNFIFNFES